MSRVYKSRMLRVTTVPLYKMQASVAHFSDYCGFTVAKTPKLQTITNGKLRPRRDASVIRAEEPLGLSPDGGSPVPSVESVRDEIKRIFPDRNICDRELFDSFVKRRLGECRITDIATLFRLSGRKSRSKSSEVLKQHLPAIASRLQALSSSRWQIKEFSLVIYGLQCLGERDAGYLLVLGTMSNIADVMMQDNSTILAQSISMILYGLQKNRCEEPESRLFLTKATKMISRCKESLSAQNVGNALYGMQGLGSDSEEVRALISALAPAVRSCKEPHRTISVDSK